MCVTGLGLEYEAKHLLYHIGSSLSLGANFVSARVCAGKKLTSLSMRVRQKLRQARAALRSRKMGLIIGLRVRRLGDIR